MSESNVHIAIFENDDSLREILVEQSLFLGYRLAKHGDPDVIVIDPVDQFPRGVSGMVPLHEMLDASIVARLREIYDYIRGACLVVFSSHAAEVEGIIGREFPDLPRDNIFYVDKSDFHPRLLGILQSLHALSSHNQVDHVDRVQQHEHHTLPALQ